MANMGKNRIVVRNPEGWRLLGRPKHRWECNIKTGLKEREWDSMDSCHMAQYNDHRTAFVKLVMNQVE